MPRIRLSPGRVGYRVGDLLKFLRASAEKHVARTRFDRDHSRYFASLDPSINRALAEIRDGLRDEPVGQLLAATARKVVAPDNGLFRVVPAENHVLRRGQGAASSLVAPAVPHSRARPPRRRGRALPGPRRRQSLAIILQRFVDDPLLNAENGARYRQDLALSEICTETATRGVLRLLALVVRDVWEKRRALPMVHTAHINLRDARIVDESSAAPARAT